MSTMTLLVFGKVQEQVGLVHLTQSTNPESVTNAVKVHNLKANFARMHTLIV